jgi:hypothetical protein
MDDPAAITGPPAASAVVTLYALVIARIVYLNRRDARRDADRTTGFPVRPADRGQ